MSSADDSCSSSGDDFVEFLDAELNEDSDSNEKEEDNNKSDSDLDLHRVKRRKVGSQSIILDQRSSSPQGERAEALRDICQHPGDYLGMCVRCGENVHKVSGVRLGYINENMTFSKDEITRLRGNDLKKLLRKKKLYLILDLDHTLLNSTMLFDMSAKEDYLKNQGDDFPDTLKTSLFRLDRLQMMTKLRPFVHTFLKEASNLFEMQIYTMGERPYALEMAKLLDPGDIYFNSRIIAQGDCTERYQKGLDVVLGSESAILILDDTEACSP